MAAGAVLERLPKTHAPPSLRAHISKYKHAAAAYQPWVESCLGLSSYATSQSACSSKLCESRQPRAGSLSHACSMWPRSVLLLHTTASCTTARTNSHSDEITLLYRPLQFSKPLRTTRSLCTQQPTAHIALRWVHETLLETACLLWAHIDQDLSVFPRKMLPWSTTNALP